MDSQDNKQVIDVVQVILVQEKFRILEKRFQYGGAWEGILINCGFEEKDLVKETIKKSLSMYNMIFNKVSELESSFSLTEDEESFLIFLKELL